MTVSISERLSPLYEGNGINTRFDFTFRVFDQEDANGVSVKHQVGANFENIDESLYSVTINPDNLGGYITFLTAPEVGFEFYIAGETPVDQQLDITNYDNFYPDAIERSLDKLTAILQEWAHSLGFEKLSREKALELLDLAIQEQIREQGLALDQIDSYAKDLANRLTNIVIERGWLAELIADGDENQKQINDKTAQVVPTISDLLSISVRKNQQTVYVQSYNAPIFAELYPYKGGDNFTYVDSLKDRYNGVTIFNGWLRDLTDKQISTYDAGLTGDISKDGDSTVKLNTIASVISDGFEVIFAGKFSISTNISFKNLYNLKITGIDSLISGNKATWVFGEKINGSTNHRGMISFNNCPNLKISMLGVKGIQKNIFGSFQDGDSCIQIVNCPNYEIRLCTLTNCFAWPIIAEGSPFPVIEYNVIADAVHQSGINACVGSGVNSKINFNHISNCGLYGIEFETYTYHETDTFECMGNVISDCFVGITPTGTGVTNGLIIGNRITKCGYTGMLFQNLPNSLSLSVFNNTLDENYRGFIFKSSPNTFALMNNIRGRAKTDLYLKINVDYFVLKVIDAHSFLIKRGAVSGPGSIYVNGYQFTVTSVTDYTDPTGEFGSDTDLSKVTVSENITEDLVLNKHLQRKVTAGSVTEANISMLNDSNSLIVKNNILSGGSYGFFYTQSKDIVIPAGTKQYVYDNEILDFDINAVLHTQSTSHVYYRGNKVRTKSIAAYVLHLDLILNGSFATKSLLQVNDGKAHTNTDKPIHYFSAYNDELIIGVYASYLNGATTGQPAVKLNSGAAVIESTPGQTLTTGRFFRINAVLKKGVNTVEMLDTVGDLIYTNTFIDLIVPA
ncbi:right-handed parallel beta-helix repeat-containing protein [Acinetobacter baumannii]|uniref:right-handed parallel beta-helix repeat-containing protein n=1 Tax=Acinetobacter baumannii TaxID=470 RepID=UPI0022EAF89A|nr:right-handed parallel beta-helix repeat-containing protein [Acinetobacter baumannii]MDA3322159.1 right-handed parallel beta-helix repeat-containing protein [Acinetobacter baumannii]MDA3438535.1 right-handed parallel beta-helix repeat-containing protein [Acinetobacter baumannii]MDA3594631.1 right-handed parallel beta-helix repeat-containing protein [Acinetobacter baumannii]